MMNLMIKHRASNGREISFLDRSFYIDETVHRPRTSTEFIARAGYISYLNQLDSVVAADIGVGSGVIAVSCALECAGITKMYGVDLYDDALVVAARNTKSLHADNKVELLQGDLFESLLYTPVDVLIANLPFANTAKVEAITAETPILDEPLNGIYGGETGFELYKKLFKQLENYRYIDDVLGIWIFCGAEHAKLVDRYHKSQFAAFRLMSFQDKFRPHLAHFLFTRVGFTPDADLTSVHILNQ